MAIDVRQPSQFSNSSAALFREWGQAIAAALVAVGLVKTADTGQINWATVPAPTGADTMMGYEVYRFADALQATSPVFLRISYGSSQYGVNYPCLIIQVINGTTDGAGNPSSGALTAPNSNYIEFGMNNHFGGIWGNGTIQTCGAPSRVAQRWMVGAGPGGYGAQWGVERTKNSDGSDNGDGVIFQVQANSIFNRAVAAWMAGANVTNGGGFMSICLINNGDQANQPGQNWCRAPYAFPAGRVVSAPARSGIFGANTAVYPWMVPSKRGYENPGLNFVGVWNTDVGAVNTQFLAKMYGADHNYRKGEATDFPGGGWFDDGAATAILTIQPALASAMRWE